MDILRYGNPKEPTKWVKKCRDCKTVMVYEESDIEVGAVINDLELCIKCPVCGEYSLVGMFDKKYNPKKHGELIEVPRKIGFKNE